MKLHNVKIKAVEIAEQRSIGLPYYKMTNGNVLSDEDLLNDGALLSHLKQFTSIQSLSISLQRENVDLFYWDSKGWSKLKELRVSSLPQYRVNAGICRAISRSLEHFHDLQILALRGAVNTTEDIKYLMSNLSKHCPNLQVLDVSDNNIIGPEHVEVILSANFVRLKELHTILVITEQKPSLHISDTTVI